MNYFEILCFSKQLKFIHYTNTLFNKLLSESSVLAITQVARDTELKDNGPKIIVQQENQTKQVDSVLEEEIECHELQKKHQCTNLEEKAVGRQRRLQEGQQNREKREKFFNGELPSFGLTGP